MAKMFYTMDETKSALGKNEEEVKQLAREGRLREFRDGSRLMFKADQVEALKGELASGGDSGEISLAPAEEAAEPTINLADSKSASSSSVLGLMDTSAGKPAKEDTQLADLGLSGSIGGLPSPGSADSAAGRTGSRGGLVVDVDESRRAEPNAQTAMGAGGGEQISLEAAGSGSGLLDLTRESDDTSLGAVFDELTPSTPGARRAAPATPAAAMETQAGEDLPVAPVQRPSHADLSGPVFVTGPDAWGAAFGFSALGATVILLFGAFVLVCALLGFRPEILNTLRTSGPMYLGVGAGVVVIMTIAGFFVGKTAK